MAKKNVASPLRALSILPLIGVIFVLTVMAISAMSSAHAPTSSAREGLFDLYQRLNPAPAANASLFHVVEIDRESLNAVGPWPWPRTVIADLASKVQAAGAKAVLFVEPVDSPDPLSPEVISAFWLKNAQDSEFAQNLAKLPSTDQSLASVFSTLSGALAVAENPNRLPRRGLPLERADAALADWLNIEETSNGYFALPSASLRFQLSNALANASPLAIAATPHDPDGFFRRAPVLWSLNGEPVPSIGLEAARLASDSKTIKAISDQNAINAAGQPLRAIQLDERTLPLSNNAMRIFTPKHPAQPQTTAIALYDNARANSQLRDKIVLIGLEPSIGGAVNMRRDSVSKAQAHAQIAAQIFSGAILSRPTWIGYVEALTVMFLGAGAIIWAQKLDFWRALFLAGIFSSLIVGGSFILFASNALLFDPLAAAAAMFLGAFSVAGGRTLGVVLRDDTVRAAFHGALPESAMKKIRDAKNDDLLQGSHRRVTVLACELRLTDDDLKRLAPHPEDITNMVASACNALRKTIIATGGAADQGDGGKVFAYFNAPLEQADHVDAACSAALRLVESMDKVNEELDNAPRTRGIQLHLAIGIASNDAVVGPMGHGRNNRYSAMGPAVEMATFLRKQAEFYGPAIICDEPIYRETHHHFAYLELDRIRTGETPSATGIYALVGNPFIKSSKSYRHLDESHRQLLSAYRSGDWEAAQELVEDIKKLPGAAIALFDIYEDRIASMAKNGAPPSDWDGALDVKI